MSKPAKSSTGLESFSDADMSEVSKDFFFEGMVLPVPVYLKMGPGSYLTIGKKGDRAAFANLHAYNNPSVGVFVQLVDQPMLVAYITQLTGKIINQDAVPENTKIKFLNSLTTDALDSLARSNFTSIEKVKKVSQMVQQLGQKLSVFDDLLSILSNLNQTDSKHSMTTCLVSLLIAEEMNMTQSAIQEKLILGALLHDVGMKYVPKDILEKPRHLWSPEELQIYEQHPLKGADMLREIKDIPQDVLLIIAEHHENAQATGFPKRLRDVKVSPLARIVGVANNFANLLFGSLAQSKSYTPDEAILYIEEVQGQPFNRQVFLALKNIINKKHLADRA